MNKIILGLVLAIGTTAVAPAGEPLQVISLNPNGLEIEVDLRSVRLTERREQGRLLTDVEGLGALYLVDEGQARLPYISELLAVPPAAKLRVDVVEERWLQVDDVDVTITPQVGPLGGRVGDPHGNVLFPKSVLVVEYAGILRGVAAHALRVYPVRYDPARRVLHLCEYMRIRVRFEGSGPPRRWLMANSGKESIYGAFLNPAHAVPDSRMPRAKPADSWYDAKEPWLKIFVERDGFYRIDAAVLATWAGKGIDSRTLRLLHQGQEQFVYVSGAEDAVFNGDDFLLFHGQFRRDEKEFESLFGRRNTYWLTWGGQAGLRLSEKSGAPVNGYPISEAFWTTAHFERDLAYDPLGLLDMPYGTLFTSFNAVDHWFDTLVRTNNQLGSVTIVGDLIDPQLDDEYLASVRLALHGQVALGHRTTVQLNSSPLNERLVGEQVWDGQSPFVSSGYVPANWLKSGRNRLLLKVFADRGPGLDRVYFNWFEITYRRLFRASLGFLSFIHKPESGRRFDITGFSGPVIEVWDLLNGIRLTDVQVNTVQSSNVVSFEDRPDRIAFYVCGDVWAAPTPVFEWDQPSDLRRMNHVADYLILTHARFRPEAERLADHRRRSGLEVVVVDVEDIYDEFSHGRVDNAAVLEFVRYAYHNWQRPMAYLLLFGDATFDYRNILGGNDGDFVPTQFYQDRERGQSPSDFFYALIDGDDLLPDLSVGRLPAKTLRQARKTVDKIISYDTAPEPGDWRRRVVYLANYHEKDIFSRPSDSLAAHYTDPLGLAAVKLFSPQDGQIPNPTGRDFLAALNDGALLVNYSGHGSVGSMHPIFDLSSGQWDYLSQIRNGGRLPLVLAFSCLNGLFTHEEARLLSLGEAFMRRQEGGCIAYISATAKSFVAQNDLLADRLFHQFFSVGVLEFGPALNMAKTELLVAHPSWLTAPLTMQLFGDPAQRLALPHAPDYEPASLEVDADPVVGHATVDISSTLANHGRLAGDSLVVAVLGYPEGSTRPETLFWDSRPAFAGEVNFSFAWSVGSRRGLYRIELEIDADGRQMELSELNNVVSLTIDILEPERPELIFPASHAVLSAAEVVLEAAVGTDGPHGEFNLSTDADFAVGNNHLSPLVQAQRGILRYRPSAVSGVLFWRARLRSGAVAGPWSPVRSFTVSEDRVVPTWRQQGSQLIGGALRFLAPTTTGDLALMEEAPPFRPSVSTRRDGFTVREVVGAGVLAADGTYVYVKRWYNDNSTVYPGVDYFTRVGTGFNGSDRQRNYGILVDSTTAGISATYHSDGFIYNDSGQAFELERINVRTGRMDTVHVPAGLLEWHSGLVEDGHSLFTSDGLYIYNVAMSAEGRMRTEWQVRVFDPSADWNLVREFTSPPTDSGFTYKWTDGILADGERLYFVEWNGQRRIRMVDAVGGRLLDEWISDQDVTRVITGQYDWQNDCMWMGDLWGSGIFRYARLDRSEEGEVLAEAIGPAANWRRLSSDGKNVGTSHVEILVPDGDDWTPHPAYRQTPIGAEIDLGKLNAVIYPRLRLRAHLAAEAALASWEVDYDPLPSLRLGLAEATRDEAGMHVGLHARNLGSEITGPLTLFLERSDWDAAWRKQTVEPMARGEWRHFVLDSLDVPPHGVRVFVELQSRLPDAYPADNRREVSLLFGGRAPLRVRTWPTNIAFQSGDPLSLGDGLLVHAPGISDGKISFLLDGVEASPDSVLETADGDTQLLFYPRVASGRRQAVFWVSRGGDLLGELRLDILFGSGLSMANALVYPHPVRGKTAFTYVLSKPAVVEVEIYSLGGWLLRRLKSAEGRAGFQQTKWDGRDEAGRLLANGTYIYRLRAVSGVEQAQAQGVLTVVR